MYREARPDAQPPIKLIVITGAVIVVACLLLAFLQAWGAGLEPFSYAEDVCTDRIPLEQRHLAEPPGWQKCLTEVSAEAPWLAARGMVVAGAVGAAGTGLVVAALRKRMDRSRFPSAG